LSSFHVTVTSDIVSAKLNGFVTVIVIVLPEYEIEPCVIPVQFATRVGTGVGDKVAVGVTVALGLAVAVAVRVGVGVTSETKYRTVGEVFPWWVLSPAYVAVRFFQPELGNVMAQVPFPVTNVDIVHVPPSAAVMVTLPVGVVAPAV
jgi:hypothetical protein